MGKTRIYLLVVGVMTFFTAFAQKEDYNWVLGRDTMNLVEFEELDYTINQFVPIELKELYITNATISDSLGQLELITGATSIFNAAGEYIQNGDTINSGFIRDSYSNSPGAYSAINGAMFLRSLSDYNEIFLFYLRGDTMSAIDPLLNNGVGTQILLSKVKKENGTYSVIEKDVILFEDTLTNNGIAACRHGNGRDWWLLFSEGGNNCYRTFLMTPDTITPIHRQCLGVKSQFLDGGQSLFTPDGSKYIRGSAVDGIEIFDFDRCSGLLSNEKLIPKAEIVVDTVNPTGFIGQVSISPNSRFLYTNQYTLFQFDLLSADIIQSKELIHLVQGPPFTYGFATHQIGPNGKIYLSGSTFSNWSIINSPNNFGITCGLDTAVPLLRGGSYGLPNLPNYRLGRLIGSECDTLYSDTIDNLHTGVIASNLSLFPNPSNHMVRIEYGNFLYTSSDQLSLVVVNLLGELTYKKELANYSLYTDIDVQAFTSGTYFVQIYNKNKLVGKRKLLVE